MNPVIHLPDVHSPDLFIVETLGHFVVKRNGRILTNLNRSARKRWTLFQYLLTHRQRSLLPETIVEELWPNQLYDSPRALMRTHAYRLRKLLAESSGDCPSVIGYTNGCYHWNTSVDCWVDTDAFEWFCTQAVPLEKQDPSQAMEYYQQALRLYHDHYLPGCAEEEWVIPVRIHYRRLFFDAVIALCRLLGAVHRLSDVLSVCDKAIMLEPHEEAFHHLYMNTLLQLERPRDALVHYRYVTSLQYRELGVYPSKDMKRLYQQISHALPGSETSAARTTSPPPPDMVSHHRHTAYFCLPPVFRSFVEVEQRRGDRENSCPLICLVTLDSFVHSSPQTTEDKPGPEDWHHLQQFLLTYLRKGDVLTQWSHNQFAVLLAESTEESALAVTNRLHQLYRSECPDSRFLPKFWILQNLFDS